MRVLRCIYSLHPSEGGPVETVRQFGLAFQAMGHTMEVASLDLPDAPHLRDFPTPVHALGVKESKYGYSPRLAPWLREHRGDYDVVIAEGIWQYNTLAVWKALRDTDTPYFVYPHGMLDPWFKQQYPFKHLKKWLYWPWAGYPVLRDARAVLFTCEEEKLLARESFWLYRANERVTPLGIADPNGAPHQERRAFFDAFPELQGKRFLLFLGRLHPKKGCDLLLEAFAGVVSDYPDLHLMMAGPGEPEYITSLQERLKEWGGEAVRRTLWPGPLSGDLKWGAFRAADAFALPSHQENFGIAVVEAMACGTPVLLSDKVNIWREIGADGAGLISTDDLKGTRSLIEGWLKLSPNERETMRLQARESFLKRFEIGQAASLLLDELQRGIDARL